MSKFKEKVLEVVSKIPPGTVVSYGQIALMAGIPRGARQVGRILCHYGEPYPWWRVINNAGRISTTCLDHTSLSQKDLLMKEGVLVDKDLNIDIEKHRWRPEPKILDKLELDPEYVEALMKKFF